VVERHAGAERVAYHGQLAGIHLGLYEEEIDSPLHIIHLTLSLVEAPLAASCPAEVKAQRRPPSDRQVEAQIDDDPVPHVATHQCVRMADDGGREGACPLLREVEDTLQCGPTVSSLEADAARPEAIGGPAGEVPIRGHGSAIPHLRVGRCPLHPRPSTCIPLSARCRSRRLP